MSTAWVAVGITAVGTVLAVIASVRIGKANTAKAAEGLSSTVNERIKLLLAELNVDLARKDTRISALEESKDDCEKQLKALAAQLKRRQR